MTRTEHLLKRVVRLLECLSYMLGVTWSSASCTCACTGGIGSSYTLSATCSPSTAGQLSYLPSTYSLTPLALPLSVAQCGQGTEQVSVPQSSLQAYPQAMMPPHSAVCLYPEVQSAAQSNSLKAWL